ncbi:putative integral membrane protein (apicoplast) [Theileria parva strain Muguga]|uniref:Ribosomal protein S11, putative n=1 Tax=Theileria parva TaxID=5875 RepID=Q4MYA7_THEPA|nr:putative integral membrane protein [Theileria parva strain Muguga]|eukprot:XP_762685.1 ribosomal protein S11 (apicoplast) [Theileria parva strain Muguga]
MNIKYITKKHNKNYNSIVVCVSFKMNNIFISISKIIKFMGLFSFSRLLKSYSCGLCNFKNKNKNSIKVYNIISRKLKAFLIHNNFKKINLIFKSNKRIKYIFLNILLNTIYADKLIKISSIYVSISIPHNGCKLKKRRFL